MVVYHFLRQVLVITSLSQVVEAGYKLLDSFILLLNATIEFGPLKKASDLSTTVWQYFFSLGVILVDRNVSSVSSRGAHPPASLPLLRTAQKRYKTVQTFAYSAATHPECGSLMWKGGAADVGLPTHPTSDTTQRSSWISKHLIFAEQQ